MIGFNCSIVLVLDLKQDLWGSVQNGCGLSTTGTSTQGKACVDVVGKKKLRRRMQPDEVGQHPMSAP